MIDARERVTGRIGYTIDREAPSMAHARLLRSRSPHARIVSVDLSRAREVPGVLLTVCGEDLARRDDFQTYFGPVFRNQPLLAIDKVRFVGDPVAAVVAEDPDAAQAALDLIEVEYEELWPVFDVQEALAEGAPLVHEAPPRLGATFADLVINEQGASNVCNHFKLRKGDVERGFAEADHVFTDTFSSPPVQHVPLETHACIAEVEPAAASRGVGRVTVTTTTQTPHVLRSQLAEIFHLPLSRVRVVVPTLGGSYGSKCYLSIEPITVALAYLARRPVRLHLAREEEFVTITKHGVRIVLETGVTRDMRIVARRATAHCNTGAYADIGPRLIKHVGYATCGPNEIPNVWVDSYAVYTNTPSAGAFRGYGVSQGAWACETQLDMIAERLGWDPYELRMRNLLVDGGRFATGEAVHDCHFRELLRVAAEAIGWEDSGRGRSSGRKVRGKGLSVVTKGTVTPSTSTASVKLNEDGSINVLTSSVEMGQGLKTVLAIVVAEQLGIPVERVRVSEVDTDVTPYDQQTSSSRSTYAMGGAVKSAVEEIKRQLLEGASALLEAGPDDLEIAEGVVRVKGAPERAVDLETVVRRTRTGNLLGHGTYRSSGGLDPETGQGIASVHWHQAAGAAEVEVDLETGKVDVLRYHAGVYAGRIMNPAQAELQTEGSVAFGLGQALFEELVFDGGQLQNGNLGDYMVASIEDLPELSLAILEHLPADEIHGLGEVSLPPVMPAIGNAVFRATGVRITDLPITPEKVLRGLRERRAACAGDGAGVPEVGALPGPGPSPA